MAFDLDEAFVLSAEEKLGSRLPDGFRRAMMENNGGGVIINGEHWSLHPIFDRSSRKRIARTCNHLIGETEKMRLWPRWPENALAIGRNDYGDALLFLPKGREYGSQVYEWSHETGTIKQVADDFCQLQRGD